MDASSGTSNDDLNAADASSSLDCRGGAFEGNRAGERGGTVYVTRGSVVTFEGCGSFGNSASLGASVYASHSFVTLSEGSVLANDEVGWDEGVAFACANAACVCALEMYPDGPTGCCFTNKMFAAIV